MRYAFISDIHSNLEAFQAVLIDLEGQKIDKTIFLGDIVGYGPNPNECIDLLKKVSEVNLGGNHDWAAVGMTDKDYFNPYALAAVDWTSRVLTDENKEFLKTLPSILQYNGMTLAHATPKDPDDWNYVLNQRDAIENYPYFKTPLCFTGHSHLPLIVEFFDEKTISPSKGPKKRINGTLKYLINAGSVGQPRDGNKDSCYLIYDEGEKNVEYRRVPYPISTVQKKMVEAGLPEYLVQRLAEGR